jgi:aminoglycoside phosphotransferase (APT) family kinase protein
VPGRSAEHEPLDPAEAPVLGGLLAALHATPTEGAPRNSWRGIPLGQVEPDVGDRLAQVADAVPGGTRALRRLQELWTRALAAPVDVPAALVHADLHPKNLVVRDGRLAAVLDWGDLTLGDPAIDLAAAWMLLPPSAHPAVRAAYGQVSGATEARVLGWAVFFGVQVLAAGLAGDAAFLAVGRTTVERLLEA